MNIKRNPEPVRSHLPNEPVPNPPDHNSTNKNPLLSPQEAAEKIWTQWKQCQYLYSQLNDPLENLKK